MTRRSARLSEALYHQPHDAQAAYALGVILSLALRLAPPPRCPPGTREPSALKVNKKESEHVMHDILAPKISVQI